MMAENLSSHSSRFVYVGSNLSVDLANTVKMVGRHLTDLLDSPEALQIWADHWGIASDGSQGEFEAIVKLRDQLRICYQEYARTRQLASEQVTSFNRLLKEFGVQPVVSIEKGQPQVGVTAALTSQLFVTVLQSALATLGDAWQMTRLKRCENPHCVLLFVDRSKNRTRRWCDMETCGNRIKASRHYHRIRESHDVKVPDRISPQRS